MMQLSRLLGPAVVLSSLLYHVGAVLCGGAQEQVLGTDTGGVVAVGAVVEYPQAVGDRADQEHPSDAMGAQVGAVPSSFADVSVTFGMSRAGPKPAVLGFLDLLPEAIRQGAPHRALVGPVALTATELAPLRVSRT